MRKLYRCLFLLGIFALAGGLWSCSDDNDEPGGNGDGTVLAVEAPASDAVFATSVTFKLKTKGAESYVYKAVEGANATEPDPVVTYAEAQEKGEVVTVKGDTDEATVTGLEGNKTYTVFFVFKVGNEYKIHSQVINTPKYSQMVTILKSDMFSITFHVEVPEDAYYNVGCILRENYETYKMLYGYRDVDFVTYNGGMQSPRFKGPRNITIENGENPYIGALNETEYAEYADPYVIHPGTGYVLFVSQCAEDGTTDDYSDIKDNGGGGDDDLGVLLSSLPNVKEYTEEKPTSENVDFTGLYAKTMLFSQQAKIGEGTVNVTIDRLTEQTALITYTPSDDILQYAIAMIDDASLEEELFPLIGGEDGLQASALIYGSVFDGVQQLAYSLEKGHTYTVYIVGLYNETGDVQSFQKVGGIKPIVSDKPAVELQVTPLKIENPYQVGFNIKAPNKDCSAFKYLFNYTKDWWPQLNSLEGDNLEANIASMIGTYGQGINNAEILNQINSADGFDLVFSSIDDTESWLVLESYNSDEKTKLFYDGDNYKVTATPLVPEERVNSELFSKLQGNWMATMTKNGVTTPMAVPVTIAAGPETVSVLPDDVKDKLIAYFVKNGSSEEQAEKTVLNNFNEYKEKAAYYTKKYEGQNWVVATGFTYDDTYSLFANSWDLFQSTEYSAFNTDELFRDYGPKMFFKIAKGENDKDEVTVVTTRYQDNGMDYYRYIDPVADWCGALCLYAFNPASAGSFYMADFPVEISDDMNTVSIKSVEQDGVVYSPGFAYEIMAGSGYFSWSFPTTADGIILERVKDGNAMRLTSNNIIQVPKVSAHNGNYFRRTRTPYDYIVKNPIKGNIFSVDSMKKNLKK